MQDLRKILGPRLRQRGILPTARQIGISDAALHRWLGGQINLTLPVLEKLADSLGFELVIHVRRARKSA